MKPSDQRIRRDTREAQPKIASSAALGSGIVIEALAEVADDP